MKRSLLLYALVLALSVMLIGGCSSAPGSAEGSTGSPSEVKSESGQDADADGDQADDAKDEKAKADEGKHKELSAEELLKDLDYDPAEYAKLPKDYDSLKIEAEGDFEYTEEKFKEIVNQNLSYLTEYEDSDKEVVEDGDVVNIDYVGKVDGKEFDGGSAEDYDLTIGSNSFIEGFETGLIGKKVGESTDLKLKFPEGYSEELSGKDVVFTVKINKIKNAVTMTYDTLTDEYVKEKMEGQGYSTKDEYLKAEKEQYQTDLDNQKKQAVMNAYVQALYKATDFSGMSKEVTDKEYKKQLDRLKEYAKQNNMKLEDYLQSGGYTEESYRKAFEESFKQGVMLQSLIKAVGFTLDQTEADAEIENIAMSYGMDLDTFCEQYGGKNEVYRQMSYSKVLEEIVEKEESKGAVTFKKPDGTTQTASGTGLNKQQTVFVVIGLFLFVAAVTLALLRISGNNKAAGEEAQDGLESAGTQSAGNKNEAAEAAGQTALAEGAEAAVPEDDGAEAETTAEAAADEIQNEIFENAADEAVTATETAVDEAETATEAAAEEAEAELTGTETAAEASAEERFGEE